MHEVTMSAGLYIHVPYCHAKCAYCDFYSTPRQESADSYVDALIAEARLRCSELVNPVTTLYIGGGTPSSLGGDRLVSLVSRLGETIDLCRLEEFTVEVNPEDVDRELVEAMLSAGVNRVSMGVQSLVDDELAGVGRRHSASEALHAAELLASAFENFSLDLIFGLPGQTLESLDYSLERLMETGAPHLSAYLLSYEPGTCLYARLMAGKVVETDEEMAEAMYSLVDSRLTSAGYIHYEISNYAFPGRESRHNSAYWNGTPYLGLGPSAHSFDGDTRRYNPADVKTYIESLQAGYTCCEVDEETIENKFNDYLITRLRTSAGLSLTDLSHRPYGYLADRLLEPVRRLQSAGLLEVDGDRITIPKSGWLASDAILRDLII